MLKITGLLSLSADMGSTSAMILPGRAALGRWLWIRSARSIYQDYLLSRAARACDARTPPVPTRAATCFQSGEALDRPRHERGRKTGVNGFSTEERRRR